MAIRCNSSIATSLFAESPDISRLEHLQALAKGPKGAMARHSPSIAVRKIRKIRRFWLFSFFLFMAQHPEKNNGVVYTILPRHSSYQFCQCHLFERHHTFLVLSLQKPSENRWNRPTSASHCKRSLSCRLCWWLRIIQARLFYRCCRARIGMFPHGPMAFFSKGRGPVKQFSCFILFYTHKNGKVGDGESYCTKNSTHFFPPVASLAHPWARATSQETFPGTSQAKSPARKWGHPRPVEGLSWVMFMQRQLCRSTIIFLNENGAHMDWNRIGLQTDFKPDVPKKKKLGWGLKQVKQHTFCDGCIWDHLGAWP